MLWNNTAYKNKLIILIRKLKAEYGNIAFASFIISVVSGVMLSISYDVKDPYDSVTYLLLTNPGGILVRNIHYWSAQCFLLVSILHIYDHLRRFTERKVKKNVWLRLTISIPVIFYLMISGFILKGDSDSQQAFRILTSLLQKLPYIGGEIAFSLLGNSKDFQLIYVHHIATATIFLWIVIIEHAKKVWPRNAIYLYILPVFIIAGYILPPGLHDNLNPLVKGPWYFLGLQEAFHLISEPLVIIVLLLVLLFLFYLLPKLAEKRAINLKKIILGFTILYCGLIVTGFFFRGEDWNFTWPWNNPAISKLKLLPNSDIMGSETANKGYMKIPVVLGRREGCLVCHNGMKGFSPAHDPSAIGCSSCHGGNPFVLRKTDAHRGMILIPGNLADARQSCGNAVCHPGITERIEKSVMTTMTGVVSVDRYVFGETSSLSRFEPIEKIGHSAAGSHLRNLCASCHLGAEKTELGPVTQLSRGGGCNACHLNYSKEAMQELSNNKSNNKAAPVFHPSLSVKITDQHCFGCHSRSGRISTSYEGWLETKFNAVDVKGRPEFRILEDGRVFIKITPDVHYENGMLCIDCHTSKEVMGDGKTYLHKEEQVKVACTDCHSTLKKNIITRNELDSESQKILALRSWENENNKYLSTEKEKIPLINTYLKNEKAFMLKRNAGAPLELKAPAPVCTQGKAHESLSCNSCHAAWSTQCVSCHMEYDPAKPGYDLLTNKITKGDWMETSGDLLYGPPALGVKIQKGHDGKEKKVVDTFVPGMIITIDKNGFKGQEQGGTLFRRLYAPAFSHTISKSGRDCISCHINSEALGYGRGKLTYVVSGNRGKWKFTPKYPLSKYDELPEDAWIGYLQFKRTGVSTRENVRPFTTEEQKRILRVGACLTCHKPETGIISRMLEDPVKTISQVSPKCVLPVWR